MNMAVFFQKYGDRPIISGVKKFYIKFFLRKNKARIKWLRDAGAKIGEGCTIQQISILGSEPYLVEIGDKTFFSGSETKIFTHDGGIAKLYDMGIAEKNLTVSEK